MLINVVMEISLDVVGLMVKLDNDIGGIGISNEESILSWIQSERFYGMSTDINICVGAWLQCLLSLLVFDDVRFAPSDDKVYKYDGVRDVFVFVPSNNLICTNAPVDCTIHVSDVVLIKEKPEVIKVSIGEGLYVKNCWWCYNC